MSLLTLGLNHESAPLAIRESLAFPPAHCATALGRLSALPDIAEGAIVSTCNRTELYTVTDNDDVARLREWLCAQHGLDASVLAPHFYTYRGRDSVRHLLRVAAGLDSMVVGEPQILGQIKDALRLARQAHTAGPLLTRLFEHSFSVAKSVRSETEIGANPVSIAYAGVSLARRIFASLADSTAMLIGAGDTAELTARHLAHAGVSRMLFANRSVEAAQKLAARFNGYAIGLEDVDVHLSVADILVTATGAGSHLIQLPAIRQAIKRRRRKPVFILDLAVPRNVDPAVDQLDDIYLYSVDDLQDIIQSNLQSRARAADLAESIIDARIDDFVAWQDARAAGDTIRALRAHGDARRQEVLDRAQAMIARGDDATSVAEYVAHTLTNKLLHEPSVALRETRGEAQQQLLADVRRLYDLDTDEQAQQ